MHRNRKIFNFWDEIFSTGSTRQQTCCRPVWREESERSDSERSDSERCQYWQDTAQVPSLSPPTLLCSHTLWCRIFIMKVNIFRRWCDAKSKTTGKPTKVNLYLKILWVHFYRNVFFIYKVNSFNVNIEENFFVVCVWQPIRLEHGGMEDEF